MNRTAIYAGTFDPMTLGHLDLVQRAAKTFDRLIVSVAASRAKHPMFTIEERVELVTEATKNLKNVSVDCFSCLLVDHAHDRGVTTIVRGLRAFSDFEYEFQMALMNRQMASDLETVFFMPREEFSYVSSSAVREIALMGGDVGRFVPAAVKTALEKKAAAMGDA